MQDDITYYLQGIADAVPSGANTVAPILVKLKHVPLHLCTVFEIALTMSLCTHLPQGAHPCHTLKNITELIPCHIQPGFARSYGYHKVDGTEKA